MPMKPGTPASSIKAAPAAGASATAAAERPIVTTGPLLELQLMNRAEAQVDMTVVKAGVALTPMPFGDHMPAVSAYAQLQEKGGDRHTVMMSIGRDPSSTSPQMTLWCGSAWLNGSDDKAGYLARLHKDTAADPEVVRALGHGVNASFGMVPGKGECHFGHSSTADFTTYDCKHTRHFAHLVLDADPALKPMFDQTKSTDMRDMLKSMIKTYTVNSKAVAGEKDMAVNSLVTPEREREMAVSKPRRAKMSAEEVRAAEMREAELDLRRKGRIYDQILDLTSGFKGVPTPVLLAGPGGWGKTFAGQEIGQNEKLFKHFVPIEILPGTEARDLVGGIYPAIDEASREKYFVSIMGRLAEGAKKAQDGRTMFLLDEVGNFDSRTWNMMKTLLNPQRGNYVLQTESPYKDGSGRWGLERIEFPVKNAVFLMTANIGEGYDSVLGDPAVRSRAVSLTFGPTREDAIAAHREGDAPAKQTIQEGREYLLRCAAGVSAERKFSNDPVNRVGTMYDAAVRFVADENLQQIPSPRNVCRAIQAAEDEGDIGRMMLYQAEKWAMLRPDNYPVREQLATARKVVEAAFA